VLFLNKLIICYLITVATLSCSVAAAASTYYVEWPRTDLKAGLHILAITIDDCETLFKIKTEDLEAFKNDDEALRQTVQTAIRRARTGCK